MENEKKNLTEQELEQASGGRLELAKPEILIGTVVTAVPLVKIGGAIQPTTVADDNGKE